MGCGSERRSTNSSHNHPIQNGKGREGGEEVGVLWSGRGLGNIEEVTSNFLQALYSSNAPWHFDLSKWLISKPEMDDTHQRTAILMHSSFIGAQVYSRHGMQRSII